MSRWFILGPLLALGCSHTERPECSEAALAKIEAAYIAEAVARCQGSGYESCDAIGEIRAKYARLRDEWEACE